MIEQQVKENKNFVAVRESFLELCKNVINENVEMADVNEMLIQHILTEEIFTTVFDDPQFHQENNISKELQKLERTFFTGKTKHDTLDTIKIYYQMIKARAGEIANHTEKQKFLKVVYENFYKAYNPKAADRLGIIYTPDEIVKFMIESADFLLHKHFGRILASKDVEILDPATGTGTFICDLIDYLPENKLKYKYQNEIHCNEIAILPYYIANLNIEATFKQKMGVYEEFKNICFVDTLDNTEALKKIQKQGLFSISLENAERVKRQNKKKISVIIGNPPYNAKQENYNFQNANRFYEYIDQRIRETYVKEGKAQNRSTLFDPFVRFIRWASDRIDQNGIVAFITNRSYVDSTAFDGFRKCVEEEFSTIYIIDTRSDVRDNPKISGTKYNVFGIQTGVAIVFMLKQSGQKPPAKIYYSSLQDEQTRKEKLEFFGSTSVDKIAFELIRPDKKHNWLNITQNDFDDLLPVIDKYVKADTNRTNAIFRMFSAGLQTKRDEWAHDLNADILASKITFLVETYNSKPTNSDGTLNTIIKWDEHLKQAFDRNIKLKFNPRQIVLTLYRPYFKQFLYYDKCLNSRTFQWSEIFSSEHKNIFIGLPGISASKPFHCLASDCIIGQDTIEKTQCLSLFSYDVNGSPVDNITDWGLKQFQTHYKDKKITKEDIFYYVYAVLHNPAYRKKYEINLKREFPRIPFCDDFEKWRDWGKFLIDLHINFESAKPFNLKRVEYIEMPKQRQNKLLEVSLSKQLPESKQAEHTPKPRLKADKEHGTIELDDQTTLTGVPKEAWEYRLGNRSALEWVLDQYKEYKPSDPTIAEKFNTYRFSDYKEKVIDLLKRVCTVSVKTMEIIEQML